MNSKTYLSLPFHRPISGSKTTEILYNGDRPLSDSYWKIGRKRSRHIGGKKGPPRMRLRFFDEPVDGSEPVSESWIDANGLRIIYERRKGIEPQYEHNIEPI